MLQGGDEGAGVEAGLLPISTMQVGLVTLISVRWSSDHVEADQHQGSARKERGRGPPMASSASRSGHGHAPAQPDCRGFPGHGDAGQVIGAPPPGDEQDAFVAISDSLNKWPGP